MAAAISLLVHWLCERIDSVWRLLKYWRPWRLPHGRALGEVSFELRTPTLPHATIGRNGHTKLVKQTQLFRERTSSPFASPAVQWGVGMRGVAPSNRSSR